MKSPRVSVGSAMIVVFAVAVDCLAIRSIHLHPRIFSGLDELFLLGTLPMAHILAVVLTRLVWREDQRRSARLGFVAVGSLAVLGTVLGLKPLLSYLEKVLTSTALGDWLASSRMGAAVVAYGVIPVLLLLFQLLAALAGGWVAGMHATRTDAVPALDPPRRHQRAGLLMMLALIAAPALVTDGALRWKVDFMTARHPAGTKAVVDLKVMNGWRVTLGDGSSFLLPNGSEVRIDDDSQPSSIAGIRTPTGEQVGDFRSVRVTLLDGERPGESTSMPRQCLRAIR